MSNQPRETSRADAGATSILRFTKHGFTAHCFNTQACKVVYAQTLQVDQDSPSKAPPPGDYRRAWGYGSHTGIPNFPPPARVEWTARDGTPLHAEVDIAEIFGSEQVLHHVAPEDLPLRTAAHLDNPGIFLEVNDRTLSVFMRQQIYLRDTPTRQGASRSDFVLAWSKTY